ncbi:MAG: hypothetical protein Fur0025_27840 [Oscillatoriaceae cyanobacterium]
MGYYFYIDVVLGQDIEEVGVWGQVDQDFAAIGYLHQGFGPIGADAYFVNAFVFYFLNEFAISPGFPGLGLFVKEGGCQGYDNDRQQGI